jgi:hypothetical protein
MAFDKQAFRALMKQRFQVASTPTFWPVPDTEIQDEAERDRLHRDALVRAEAARQAAIADLAAHASAQLVTERLPELWPTDVTENADPAPLLQKVQDAIAAGDGEALEDAAVLLLVLGFARLVKE